MSIKIKNTCLSKPSALGVRVSRGEHAPARARATASPHSRSSRPCCRRPAPAPSPGSSPGPHPGRACAPRSPAPALGLTAHRLKCTCGVLGATHFAAPRGVLRAARACSRARTSDGCAGPTSLCGCVSTRRCSSTAMRPRGVRAKGSEVVKSVGPAHAPMSLHLRSFLV